MANADDGMAAIEVDCYFTVVVFTGLTAYDTQKMLRISNMADGSDIFAKAAVIGALELYLDFINIFLALLRLFGRGRK